MHRSVDASHLGEFASLQRDADDTLVNNRGGAATLGDEDFSNKTIAHARLELRISSHQQLKIWKVKILEAENKTPAHAAAKAGVRIDLFLNSELTKFCDATRCVPVLDVEIAIFVKGKAVRSGEDAEFHFFFRNSKSSPLSFVWVVAKK